MRAMRTGKGCCFVFDGNKCQHGVRIARINTDAARTLYQPPFRVGRITFANQYDFPAPHIHKNG